VSDIQIEEAKPNVEEVSSVYHSEDINTALESGDIAFAKDIISELVRVSTENYLAKERAEAEYEGEKFDEKKATEKAEIDAKSSVRSSITSYWKPLYKEAHASGNTTEMLRIRDLLFDSGLFGDTRIAVKKTMDGWLEKK
jgi:hypothetical protein